MPVKGRIYQYGNITLKDLGTFFPEEFLFKDKQLRGFWLSHFYESLSNAQKEEIVTEIAAELAKGEKGIFHTAIQGVYNLEDYLVARKAYLKGMTKGKVLMCPCQ